MSYIIQYQEGGSSAYICYAHFTEEGQVNWTEARDQKYASVFKSLLRCRRWAIAANNRRFSHIKYNSYKVLYIK